MFKTENYTIRFKRNRTHQGDGFHTVCSIYRQNGITFLSAEIAFLHPKDRYNKITGKKVALTKALARYPNMFTKQQRKEIWEGFWKWVKGWKEVTVTLTMEQYTAAIKEAVERGRRQVKEGAVNASEKKT
jgi:hypothetical protein